MRLTGPVRPASSIASAIAVALALAPGCGREPVRARRTPGPSSESVPASSGSTAPRLPFVGTGAPAGSASPIAALEARTYALEVDGSLLYAGTTAGVVAWDFADLAAPRKLGTLVLAGSVSGVARLESGRLAVSTGPTGVVLVDASGAREGRLVRASDSPWTPESQGGCHAAWTARSSGPGRLVAACGAGGVAEIAMNDRSSNVRVTRTSSVGGYVRDVALLAAERGAHGADGGPMRAVAAAGQAGLVVLELVEGRPPRILSRLATDGESRAVQVVGDRAFVADGPAGLRVVDLRDPARPSELGRLDPKTTDMARGLAVQGTLVTVCLGDSGLLVVDASDPARLRQLSIVDPVRAVNRAVLDGTRLFAANDAGGVLVLDMGSPSSPRTVYPVAGR